MGYKKDSLSIISTLRSRHVFVIAWAVALASCLYWNYSFSMRYSSQRDQAYLWGWDNNGYFAWGRSMALDGDIHFENDFDFIAGLDGFGITRKVYADFLENTPRTITGHVPNKYGLGSGLISLPSLYLARLISLIYESVTGIKVSQYAAIYVLAFNWTSIIIGFLGLLLSFRLLRDVYGARLAGLSVLSGATGLSITHYFLYEPSMAHLFGFGVSVFFIAATLHWWRVLMSRGAGQNMMKLLPPAFVMGFLLGISTMIRYPDCVMGLVPPVLAIAGFLRIGREGRMPLLHMSVFSLFPAMIGFVVGFMPQMIAWKTLYGSYLYYSYQGEHLAFWPKNILLVLFGERNSLFLWTPLALISVTGLLLGAARKQALFAAGGVVLVAMLWIYGGWENYWLGSSYGMRGLVDIMFFLFLGLGEIMSRISRIHGSRVLRNTLLSSIILLVMWNLFFLQCYRARIQPHEMPFVYGELFGDWDRLGKRIRRDLGCMGGKKYTIFTIDRDASRTLAPTGVRDRNQDPEMQDGSDDHV